MASNTPQQSKRQDMMLNQPVGQVIIQMAIPVCLYMLRKIKTAAVLYSAEISSQGV